ncbi:MAG: DNA photolyase [Chrysiogenales bacterium]|nr:MAG: DNA photolyase [Chrysiogenales bacterium]
MRTIDDIKALLYDRVDRRNDVVGRFLSRGTIRAVEYDGEDGLAAAIGEMKREGVASKEAVILKRFMGRIFQKCPGSPGMICCNYRLMNIGFNCLYDCAYCFLNYYLNSYGIVQFIDADHSLRRVDSCLSADPDGVCRIGTGEYTDSLMLDEVTGIGAALITEAAGMPGLFLEFKTKSDNVGHLLDINEKGNTVLAWTISTPRTISLYESGTASLERRLAAASAACGAGYLIAFHFDPIILPEERAGEYLDLVDRAFAAVDPERVAWVSLGCFRYSPGFRDFARGAPSCRGLTSAEMFQSGDGKYRYLRPHRIAAYSSLLERIRFHSTRPFVYLCMETESVWREVFGVWYRDSDELERAFSAHLRTHFI